MKNKIFKLDCGLTNDEMAELQRHWNWSNLMYQNFERLYVEAIKAGLFTEANLPSLIYGPMGGCESIWHGLLYEEISFLGRKKVTVPDLSLSREIKELLGAKRNTVFHLQGKYNSEKYYQFYKKESAQEVQDAHFAIGRLINVELKKQLEKKDQSGLLHLYFKRN